MSAWTLSSAETPLRGRFYFVRQIGMTLGMMALVASWLAANHYPPWTSFHGEVAAFASLVAICLAQALEANTLFWRGPLVVGIGAAVMLVLQWMTGQIAYGGDAFLSTMYLLGACWAWWAGASAARRGLAQSSDLPFTLLSATFILGAIASVHVGLLQWLRMEPVLGIFAADRGPDMRVFANLGQPNHLATLCAMAAPMGIWLYRSGRLKGWHLLVILAYLAAGITMSESRSGLLGGALVGAFVLGILSVRRRAHLGRAYWPVIAWWIFLLAGALSWSSINEILILQPSRVAQMTSDGARTTMWKQSLAAISASPWWGYGWRQTMFAQKVAAAQVPGWLATDYAHNILLDLMIWIGVPSAALLLLWVSRWTLRTATRIDGDRQLFLAASVVPFAFHSLFEFPFAYSYFLLPVAWILGHLAAEQRSSGNQSSISSKPQPLALACLAIYACIGIAVTDEYLRIEEDYRVMRFELRKVGRTPEGYERPEVIFLTQLDAIVKAGRMSPRAGMSGEELATMRVASERNGWATLDLGYATALALNGQPEDAQRRLELISAVYGPESGAQARAMFRQLNRQMPKAGGAAHR